MVRVVLGGPELARFTPNQYSDAYVKLLFLRPGVEYPRPIDPSALRDQLPPSDWPQQRTYTVRTWDPDAQELTIDFVVHGDEGVAGPWARAAQPGDEVLLNGPGGGYAAVSVDGKPEQTVSFHNTAQDGNTQVWSTSGLSPGQHTVTVRVTGTHPAGSTGDYVSLDRLEALN
jgi:NADPH-dependent ferric siderophore reductase